jgi:hypothetical protein
MTGRVSDFPQQTKRNSSLNRPSSDIFVRMTPAKRRLVKTSIYLEKSTLAALKQISEKTGIPQAVLIRRGVESVLKQYRKK